MKGVRSKPANYIPASLTCTCRRLIGGTHHHIRHGPPRSSQHIDGSTTWIQFNSTHHNSKYREEIPAGCHPSVFLKGISHIRLLSKAAHYGVTGQTLNWVEQFVTCRYQNVVLDNESLNSKEITSGVPQGTALQPLPFLMFTNDLPEDVT